MNLNDVKDRIKEQADLGALISKYTKPVKTATGFKACCPLPGHKEKTPSFHYNQKGNYFFCYGCNRGGDIFKFLELVEGLPFFEALKDLAEQNGITLPRMERTQQEVSESANQPASVKEKGFDLLNKAKIFYSKMLSQGQSSGATKAVKYLEERRLSKNEVDGLGLGWAPEGGDPISKKMSNESDFELARQVGLVRNFEGRKYDFFRNRLIIPIFDPRGRPVGFSGRTLDEVTSKNPKYINSSESEWFKKKAILYGLERAQKFIREESFVCIVEGFFDQWAFDRCEIPAVAVMGTALTMDHLSTLGRYTKNVILVLDSDDAGVNSTKKSVVLLLENGWKVRVFSEFEGKDPDEWLQSVSRGESGIKNKVKAHLQGAREGLEWLSENTLAQAQRMNSSRTEIIESLQPVWSLAKDETQKLRMLELLGPVIGFGISELRKIFEEASKKVPPKTDSTSQIVRSQLPMRTTLVPNLADKVSRLDKLAEQSYLWLIWHKEFLWPKNDSQWSEIEKVFQGTYLQDVVQELRKNSEFWGSDGPETLAETQLENHLIDAFLRATLIKSLVRVDKGQAEDSPKALNSLMEMVNSLELEKTNRQIAVLKNELRKNSHDLEKTAHILQQIQTLISSNDSRRKIGLESY
jgi:DNA primase